MIHDHYPPCRTCGQRHCPAHKCPETAADMDAVLRGLVICVVGILVILMLSAAAAVFMTA